MTISSQTRKAGPYIGAGTTSTFPFSFKVFQASDVLVVRLDTATQIETTLALTTNYTVSLNADQDNSPGGNITLVGGALATGYNLVISSKVPYTQGTDITNMGGFYPEVIEDALDKLCIEVQQIKLDTDRAAKLPITSTESTDDLVADLVRLADSADNIDTVANNIGDVNDVADNMADVNLVADHMTELVNFATVYQGSAATDPATRLNGSPLQPGDLYFNTTYNEMRVYTASGWKSTVNYAATVERFSGDGSTVAFNLSAAPLGENNTQLYISGVYQQKNTYEVSGTTITFSSAPPAGTDNIEVVVFTSLIAGATVDSANVQFTPAGTGAVSTTVQAKLRETVSVKDFGAVGDGVTDDTAAIQAAVDAIVANGGGTIYFPAGEYSVKNGNPSATSWDNQVAIWVLDDNVHLVGAGQGATVIKLANSGNAHVIKFGQRVGATISVSDCSVSNMTIDGNRANQTTPTATDYHWQGIDVASGATRLVIKDLHIHDTQYYGIGLQNTGFVDCVIDSCFIEKTGADGIDIKDNSGTSSGNIVSNITVRNFGLEPLGLQAGLNIRSGVVANNIFASDYSGSNHGIRFDPIVATSTPSVLTNFVCKPSAVDTTVGVYCNLATAPLVTSQTISNGYIYGANYGVDVRQQYSQITNVKCISCSTGFRVYQHNQLNNVMARSCTTVGYKVTSNTNTFTNVYAYSNSLGAEIDSTASFTSFRNGVFSGNTTNVSDSGTQTAISQIAGINTDSVGTASVAIDSTGEKTITVAHGLSFIPELKNVSFTLQRDTNVIDFDIVPPYVYSSDATNVYCKVLVKTASSTAGAKITLLAHCVAKKAIYQ